MSNHLIILPFNIVSFKKYITKKKTPEFIQILLLPIKWGEIQSVLFLARLTVSYIY